MSQADRSRVIWRFKQIVRYLESVPREPERIGLDVQNVEELTVIDYKSRGYSKAAKVRETKKVHFEKLDFEAPKLEAIIPLYEEIVRQLETEDKPDGSRRAQIKSILSKLGPYGSWATLAFTLLHTYGVI